MRYNTSTITWNTAASIAICVETTTWTPRHIKLSFSSRHQSISSAKRSAKRRKQNYAGRNALRSRDTDLTKIKLRLYGVGHRRAQNKFLERTCSLQHTELDTLVIDWSDEIPDQSWTPHELNNLQSGICNYCLPFTVLKFVKTPNSAIV